MPRRLYADLVLRKHARAATVSPVTGQQSSSDFNRRVGANVQQFRKAAGMAQADLANRLSARGLPFQQPTVLKVEKGVRPLKAEEVAAIADVLGVGVALLLDDPEAKTTAALAQLHTATTGIARCDRQIAELEEEKRRYQAMEREAAASLPVTVTITADGVVS
jgi:transcriptional regulator with XRE-family HTH domain